jgi:predicted subunit of tRNA(5-methylaminomethyl-2-thiouridylate) methyltransferase
VIIQERNTKEKSRLWKLTGCGKRGIKRTVASRYFVSEVSSLQKTNTNYATLVRYQAHRKAKYNGGYQRLRGGRKVCGGLLFNEY